MRSGLRAALTVALLGALAACTSGQSGGTASASCAAAVVYDGHLYLGQRSPKRDPATTGRLFDAVLPGCDDTGGQLPGDPAERVKVAELADVPITTAFLWQDIVFVRRGHDLPTPTRAWFRAPRCTTPGLFTMAGDWLGVTGRHRPRFDGDIRAPYRLEVHVLQGPEEYVGATLHVRADASTRPGLGPRDVKASLRHGGQVVARVDCVDGQFHAVSLRAPSKQ